MLGDGRTGPKLTGFFFSQPCRQSVPDNEFGSDRVPRPNCWVANLAPVCIDGQFNGVPIEDQMAIGRNNAIKCYKLPLELAVAPSRVEEPAQVH